MDEFLVPGVEDAVDFDVEDLPPELFCVVFSVCNVFLSLLHVLDDPLIKAILLSQTINLSKRRLKRRVFLFDFFQKGLDGLVAYFLTDDELILTNFLIRIVIVVFLREVNPHTSQQFSR